MSNRADEEEIVDQAVKEAWILGSSIRSSLYGISTAEAERETIEAFRRGLKGDRLPFKPEEQAPEKSKSSRAT